MCGRTAKLLPVNGTWRFFVVICCQKEKGCPANRPRFKRFIRPGEKTLALPFLILIVILAGYGNEGQKDIQS